jgi:hypothetical protein
MNGSEARAAIRRAQEVAALPGEDHCAAHEGPCRKPAEGHDQSRLDQQQFPVKPPTASVHFLLVWALMKTPFAAHLIPLPTLSI